MPIARLTNLRAPTAVAFKKDGFATEKTTAEITLTRVITAQKLLAHPTLISIAAIIFAFQINGNVTVILTAPTELMNWYSIPTNFIYFHSAN